jgi:hypothetical protein
MEYNLNNVEIEMEPLWALSCVKNKNEEGCIEDFCNGLIFLKLNIVYKSRYPNLDEFIQSYE